ncbi:NADAR family protein [Mycolicibacterium alvei]|uniref:NADAR domain-containing protein n=1 Tax=Mycolicibacterium alvei TaxID=67081 RepID=A0A6N4UXJ6_9MYCO|nr:NADAR family protein [Mycolicibacterium alvei]BBX29630.1 hypothetical protein MALV_47550 [Mycolicibacterium alvei]
MNEWDGLVSPSRIVALTATARLGAVAGTSDRLLVPVIDRFRGEHFFLSNHYPAVTPHRGHLFPTSEHAYMAAKTDDQAAIAAILATEDPNEAKTIAAAAPLVDHWGTRKYAAMEDILTAKFTHNPDLAHKLIATAGTVLVEGNTWHDQTWGTCTCDEHRDVPGDNALGVILMVIRMRLAISNPQGSRLKRAPSCSADIRYPSGSDRRP